LRLRAARCGVELRASLGCGMGSSDDELPPPVQPAEMPPLPPGARAPQIAVTHQRVVPRAPAVQPPPTLTPEEAAERQRMQTKRLHKQITIALFRVVFPVVLCMGLSVYLVHSLGTGACRESSSGVSRTYTPPGLDQYLNSDIFPQPPGPSEPGSNTDTIISIILLSVFAVAIVVMTFVLVLLYKYHCEWILFVWLILAVVLVLGYEGGLYLWEWCRSVCFPMDWVTLALLSWNFACVGVAAIFWRVPRLINQTFLILLSGLMAWVFSAWEVWAAWALLGLLVVWDLIAVLTPCGPLRMLVAAAKERGDPLPALVYDTNPDDIGRDAEAKDMLSVIKFRKKKRPEPNQAESTENLENADVDEDHRPADSGVSAAGAIGMCVEVGNLDLTSDGAARSEITPVIENESAPTSVTNGQTPAARSTDTGAAGADGGGDKSVLSPQSTAVSPRKLQFKDEGTAAAKAVSGEQVGFLGTHLKLGLGDFVFYSLLVATASRESVMTTITSFVAILSGLCLTLFLLVMFRKPLPALPISITLGIIFNFVTRYTIQPFVYNLFPELLFT